MDAAQDRIRANQGHSVDVDLGLAPTAPPAVLFHGTPEPNVEAVLAAGLHKGDRHAVHLSPDWATARQVRSRRVVRSSSRWTQRYLALDPAQPR